jgi:hypothetical protein
MTGSWYILQVINCSVESQLNRFLGEVCGHHVCCVVVYIVAVID